MTDVTQLLPGGGRVQPQRQIVAGYVSTNKPAPVDFSSALYVILPQLDPSYNFGPCKWGAAQGSTLPARGTEVLVCFDDQNVPVVVWWEGSPGFAPTGSAGGDLAGSFPNPTIGSGKVTTAKIATGAVTSTQILDGTIAVGDLATGIVLQLASTGTARKVAFGTTNVTWPGATTFSSTATVTHGLGTTPLVVLITDNGGGTLAHIPIFSAFSYGATTFGVNAETGDLTSPAAATSRNFAWLAIG